MTAQNNSVIVQDLKEKGFIKTLFKGSAKATMTTVAAGLLVGAAVGAVTVAATRYLK